MITSQPNDEALSLEKAQIETGPTARYMIFQMGGETYGTPLLKIREVIENRSTQPVPNSAPSFKGVLNLRGNVVGVIDLRKLLNIEPRESLAILIFESEGATLGAIVDRCLSVSEIRETDIRRIDVGDPAEKEPYFLGIGKIQESLVTLIDLTYMPKLLQSLKV